MRAMLIDERSGGGKPRPYGLVGEGFTPSRVDYYGAVGEGFTPSRADYGVGQ